jgi:ATP-dependent DNA helicase 2 subunit 2
VSGLERNFARQKDPKAFFKMASKMARWKAARYKVRPMARWKAAAQARYKESLVLLIDISPSMHKHLHHVERAMSTLVRRRVFFSKNDDAGLVLFGSEEADNDLWREIGGYESVVVFRPIKAFDEDLLEALNRLPRGMAPGDFLDAIVVGVDLLIKKLEGKSAGNKRLLLITGAQSLIKKPDEGTKEDQVDIIANQMEEHGIKLDVVIFRQTMPGLTKSELFSENLSLLNRFSKQAQAEVIVVESSSSLLGAVKARNIFPVTVFRGDLELTPMMRIQVWVYKKTMKEKIPTLKKYSDKAPPNDPNATREVKMDVDYKSREDPDKKIPPDQRIKGFHYGPQVVPISIAEQEALKFKPEKGLKLLGFTDAANILRHYYMKDTNIFMAEPGNTNAILAVSAMARAMEATKKVAILRCVWKRGNANVVLGILTPNISNTDNVGDSFYFNAIPFAEDIREFPFASFNSFPASQQPNSFQQKAADNFVQMLDLALPGREEAVKPELTLNPVLERFYSFLHIKSRRSDADVPPIDDAVKRIIEPDPELFDGKEIFRFCSQFQLKMNPKTEKASKSFWRNKSSLSEEAAGIDAGDDVHSGISFDSLAARKTKQVGSLTPVQDFEAMLARQDSGEWVPKAIREMKKLITDLLDSSYKGNTYHKTMDCLVALRNGSVQQEEPMEFNSFMHELANKCQGKRLNEFWELLVSKNVSLINKNEAVDSDVTEEEAKAFLTKSDEKPPEVDVEEMEQILREIV